MERYVGFECGKTKADMGKPVCVCLCQFEHWHKIAYQCAKKKKKTLSEKRRRDIDSPGYEISTILRYFTHTGHDPFWQQLVLPYNLLINQLY